MNIQLPYSPSQRCAVPHHLQVQDCFRPQTTQKYFYVFPSFSASTCRETRENDERSTARHQLEPSCPTFCFSRLIAGGSGPFASQNRGLGTRGMLSFCSEMAFRLVQLKRCNQLLELIVVDAAGVRRCLNFLRRPLRACSHVEGGGREGGREGAGGREEGEGGRESDRARERERTWRVRTR